MTAEQSKHNRKWFEQVWKDEIDRVEKLKSQLPLDSKIRASFTTKLAKGIDYRFFHTSWIVEPFMFASSAARITMSVALGFLIQSFIDNSGDGYWWTGVMQFRYLRTIIFSSSPDGKECSVASIFAKSLRLKSGPLQGCRSSFA